MTAGDSTQDRLIAASAGPWTRDTLAADLRVLGVAPGDILLVHSSLSALGWVVGGEVAVVLALLDAVGPQGSLAVPTQTGGNSDPAGWRHPPVPKDWWPSVRAGMPAYDPRVTPSQGMGLVAEAVRTWPGSVRSAHPQTSFAALGRRSSDIVAVHDLDCQCGERSPLAALERLEARVLFLGTGWDTCTALHLAEYRVEGRRVVTHGCSVTGSSGAPQWITFEDIELDADPFEAIGRSYLASGPSGLRTGRVGSGVATLFPMREAVAFGVDWLTRGSDRGRPSGIGAG